MPKQFASKASLLLGLIIPFLIVGCDNKEPEKISYSQDILPILKQHCIECHNQDGVGFKASGLDMSSFQNLMKGTKFGPIIKAGDSTSSTLVILVEGRADPSLKMPHGDRDSLTSAQTQKIRQWIDQGALQN